jgi:signal transduction histidine kinase
MEPAEPLVLPCRPAALKRALRNLIDNAVRYGARADISIVAMPPAVEITIDDQGPGIPEAELARVFQPFYRLDEARGAEVGGAGLGLAIALATVEAHGGELQLRNRANGGLRAAVKLPR